MTIASLPRVSTGAVVFGVRPEDVAVAAPGQGDFDAPVYAAELTGESLLVTLVVGDSRLAARADRDLPIEMGQTVGVRVDTRRLHLFDAASGLRL
jgi:multiple sugar transport system ATP-binding protein